MQPQERRGVAERITVVYGEDPKRMTREALEAFGASSLVSGAEAALLKPNLVTPAPASSGATTHPQVTAAVIEFLLDRGVRSITIGESSWTGADTRRAFRACGYEELAGRYGVRLLDFKAEAAVSVRAAGLELKVCRSALEAELLVNLPVLKGHCQTRLTCALKNLKGCIPDEEKRRYHRLGLDRPIAALASILRQDLIVVDGICGDPDSELGGSPLAMQRVLVGTDPVLVDSYGAELLGFESAQIGHISASAEAGVGSMDLGEARIVAHGRPAPPAAGPSRPRRGGAVERCIVAEAACSACYGSVAAALARVPERLQGLQRAGGVHVGQGFRGLRGGGIGVGSCASGLDKALPGCPPTAAQIAGFLRRVGTANRLAGG